MGAWPCRPFLGLAETVFEERAIAVGGSWVAEKRSSSSTLLCWVSSRTLGRWVGCSR